MLKDLDRALLMAALLSDDDSSDVEDILEMRSMILSSRFMNLRAHVHKNRSMNEMLWRYGDKEFKMLVRMKKESFLKLLDLISTHPVFGNNHQRHKQAPIWVQLMVVLGRLGCDGNGVSVGRCGINSEFSVGSVCKFTERVFTAILSLHDRVISWPNARERKEISARMGTKFGLPGAVSIVDGTACVFAQKPTVMLGREPNKISNLAKP